MTAQFVGRKDFSSENSASRFSPGGLFALVTLQKNLKVRRLSVGVL
jgi:hypothetical protein